MQLREEAFLEGEEVEVEEDSQGGEKKESNTRKGKGDARKEKTETTRSTPKRTSL